MMISGALIIALFTGWRGTSALPPSCSTAKASVAIAAAMLTRSVAWRCAAGSMAAAGSARHTPFWMNARGMAASICCAAQ
jgi:hypothetical protein